MDKLVTALPGIDDNDPFQEIADQSVAIDDAVKAERFRCAEIVQQAIEQAGLRGLVEHSPLVRILSSIRHSIEIG